ncbi:MAG TPA: hypothetical protein VFN68_15220 [Acidimicrobiales bacterium]|nr:hypothetical protein [Acidimicrobiales bacterium]
MNGSEQPEGMELAPHLDPSPAYLVHWDRDWCRMDLQALHSMTSDEIEQRIDRYEAHVRLTLDGRGPGFVDSEGGWRPVPAETARLATLSFEGPSHGTPGATWSEQMRCLLFLDRDGRVLLVVPYYGWNVNDLERWAGAAGWDTEIGGVASTMRADEAARERAFPNFKTAPKVPVGAPYFVPEPAGDRLRRKLHLFRR